MKCAKTTLDLLAGRAAKKGLDLLYEDWPTACRGEQCGDVTRLRQILVNLLGNAVKFTEVGRSRADRAGDGRAAATGRSLDFAVRDTGIGIPPDRMERLFRSFTQVDASTTRRYGGTGLGLAISKRLVEMMDGHLWVESEADKGSRRSSSSFRCASAQRSRGVPRAEPALAGQDAR